MAWGAGAATKLETAVVDVTEVSPLRSRVGRPSTGPPTEPNVHSKQEQIIVYQSSFEHSIKYVKDNYMYNDETNRFTHHITYKHVRFSGIRYF